MQGGVTPFLKVLPESARGTRSLRLLCSICPFWNVTAAGSNLRQVDRDSMLFRGTPAFYSAPVVRRGHQSIVPNRPSIFFLAFLDNIYYC